MRRLFLVGLMVASAAIASAATAAEPPAGSGFQAWLQSYRAGAMARGLPAEWLDRTLADSQYLPRVVALDRNQPDDSGTKNVFSAYLARQLTAQRIAAGRAAATANRALLQRIGRDTGVAPELLVAIWGMETSYGRIQGGFDLPSALATLAYDGRRAQLFEGELDALVRIVGEQNLPRADLRGSWAGAIGQAQFLPSSYLAYAVDGDGDGRIDLRNSVADALQSIGNYLKQHGARADIPWGFRVGLPPGFDRASIASREAPERCIRPLERHSDWHSVGEWKAMGLRPLNAFWPADTVELTLVEPDGPQGDAYLTSRSYRALLEYNCSNFYALSVGLLADAVAPALRP